jgi:fructose-1,6-bisphosphatase II
MDERESHNLGFELVRVTETTALVAGRWLGVGDRESAHLAATQAMATAINSVDIDGCVVMGEEGRIREHSPLDTGNKVGTGKGPKVDVMLDPIDGTRSVVRGRPAGAISVASIAPRGSMWSPQPAVYMEKIVVDREAAPALVPECMDAPVAWTLALIARVKGKEVRDLQVVVLDRRRHRDLIDEIRHAGARVLLRSDGDTTGALIAATPDTGADVLMGVGGIAEGVTAACAVKAMGGAMLGRLAPQSEEERAAVQAAGLDTRQILTCDQLVAGDQIFFAATGVTHTVLLEGVQYRGNHAKTHSLVIRSKTGTQRFIRTEYNSLDTVLGVRSDIEDGN